MRLRARIFRTGLSNQRERVFTATVSWRCNVHRWHWWLYLHLPQRPTWIEMRNSWVFKISMSQCPSLPNWIEFVHSSIRSKFGLSEYDIIVAIPCNRRWQAARTHWQRAQLQLVHMCKWKSEMLECLVRPQKLFGHECDECVRIAWGLRASTAWKLPVSAVWAAWRLPCSGTFATRCSTQASGTHWMLAKSGDIGRTMRSHHNSNGKQIDTAVDLCGRYLR